MSYYLIDEKKLLKNLEIVKYLRTQYGIRVLIALKSFNNINIGPICSKYVDGISGSELEVLYSSTKYNGEIFLYSVAYIKEYLNRIIKEYLQNKNVTLVVNSISEYNRYANKIKGLKSIGIRVNPGVGYSEYDIVKTYDNESHLGVKIEKIEKIEEIKNKINGYLIHVNCDNYDIYNIKSVLYKIVDKLQKYTQGKQWVNLGGGYSFTEEKFDIDEFGKTLVWVKNKLGVNQLYIEPGEAIVNNVGSLVVNVLDIIDNNTIVVDASVPAHLSDKLLYKGELYKGTGKYTYKVVGRSCMRGDVFGDICVNKKLKVGDTIELLGTKNFNILAYNPSRANWFNGLNMPGLRIRHINGKEEIYKKEGFDIDIKNYRKEV